MIADLKPYPEYKESGQEWLGQVPKHWEVRRTKFLLREMDSRSSTGKEQLLRVSQYTGVTQRKSADGTDSPDTRAASLKGYKVVSKNDLVINIMLAWNGSLGISRFDGIASPAYCVYRLKPEVEPWYFHELLRLPAYKGRIKSASTGVVESRLRLYSDDLGCIEALLPPPSEQSAIVRFLDHWNGRLEKAIRSKRRVIALLQEQKQAIIHRAVTRGLDPNVKLKDSGIPWLGEIPEYWEVRRLRTLTRRIEQGVSPQATGFLAEGDTWGVLKSGCINHGIFRQTEHKQLSKDFVIDPGIVVKVGDVLISRACGSPKLVGSVGKVKALDYQLILSDKTFRAVFSPIVDTDFMVYAMNGVYYRQQVEQAISGADGMANNLPLSELKCFVFAIPPLAEASDIASTLDAELARFTNAITRYEREITLLREYRTRLTADVVTGKLDVRAAAAQLPEEAEEEPLPDPELPEEESEVEEAEE
jgi:type I restriction enzyme, S subunit